MKKLEELNLVDDFLFGSVLSYPGIGETFARELLETVFDRKFGKMTVIPQKVYYGGDRDRHGARLDVYIEETEDWEAVSAVYDVEAQSVSSISQSGSLPKRVRFYHAKIDGASLKTNEDYRALKTVVVIMILPYDPFGQDHMVYTIKNGCIELPDMPYEDGARTIFLYTRGKKGQASEALRQMLWYFEDTTAERAGNEKLKQLHQLVERVRKDKEVSAEYMLWSERERMWEEEGYKRGRAEERKQTEAERQRAETALKELEVLRRELEQLRAQIN